MKKSFLAGLVILIPLAVTLWVFWYILDFFTTPFLPFFLQKIGKLYPNVSSHFFLFLARIVVLLFLFIFIFLLGVVGRGFFARVFSKLLQNIVYKIPLIKGVYRVSKDIVEALFSDKREKAFRHPVIVNFPGKNNYSIAFSTGVVPPCCQKKSKETLTSVFVPTAPHPISGYLLLIPEKFVKPVAMSNEEALQFTISCGLVFAPSEKTL